jgi:hypothetical protein
MDYAELQTQNNFKQCGTFGWTIAFAYVANIQLVFCKHSSNAGWHNLIVR